MNRGRATSGRYLRDARPPPSDARILPLINIVFLLLIFFMLAGRFAFHDPFRITPPRSGSERAAAGRDLLVPVAADGRLVSMARSWSPPRSSRRWPGVCRVPARGRFTSWPTAAARPGRSSP